MRVGTVRWLLFAMVIVPFAAVAAAAPPMADTKTDTKGNGEVSTSERRAQLQADLLQLLKKINNLPPTPTPPMPSPHGVPGTPKKVETSDGSKVNAIKEGMNLFRDGKFDAARLTFQLIEPSALDKEDRAFVRYMLACSYRRLGKTSEAEVIYREVANSQDDEFLTSCAIWQLSLMRSEQELQLQLEQLRSRAKTK
jgi:hypothetical protein